MSTTDTNMHEITYRPFNPHSDSLAVTSIRLSPSDIVEMVGKGYHSVPTYIANALALSHESWVIEVKNVGIVGVFGIRYLDNDEAIPWMLSGPSIEEYSYRFLRESSRIASEWSKGHNLSQEVWEGNYPALRWLQWLGFEDMLEDRTMDGSIIYRTLRRPRDV